MAAKSEGKGFVKVIFDVKTEVFGVGGEGVWAKPMAILIFSTKISRAKGGKGDKAGSQNYSVANKGLSALRPCRA